MPFFDERMWGALHKLLTLIHLILCVLEDFMNSWLTIRYANDILNNLVQGFRQ